MRLCPLCRSSSSATVFEATPYRLVRCTRCDLVFVANPPTRSELAHIYSFASGYDTSFADDPEEIAYRQRLARDQVRWLESFASPGRLLDVGASAGFFVRAAADAGWEARGVELSADTSRLARERYGVDVTCGRLEDVAREMPTGSVDAITMWDVLEHVDDPVRDLEHVAALLRSGGILVISTPNLDGWYPRLSGRVARRIGHWPAVEPPWHLTQFGVRTLTRMLQRAGLEVVCVRHVRIPLSYSFGALRELRSPKRLAFAAVFAPVAAVAPWFKRGDEIEVVARVASPAPGGPCRAAFATATAPDRVRSRKRTRRA